MWHLRSPDTKHPSYATQKLRGPETQAVAGHLIEGIIRRDCTILPPSQLELDPSPLENEIV